MKRLELLLGMLVMTVLLLGAVALFSPYAPVVAPVMDIEAIWAIEDSRRESETPLVTTLENHGMRLGYDAQENTFYCTLGMANEDVWPDIHLTAPGAKGVNLVFVDDYSYDWCADAIRDGYPYQILTYTDTEFAYAQIVFTSLPIVVLASQEEIPPHVDVPVDVAVSWQGEKPLKAYGRAHRRGASSVGVSPKNGLKVEFTRRKDGRDKVQLEVPFLRLSNEMTLLPCWVDPLMIRDRLCWDMYSSIMDDDEPFGDVDTRYVELFINENYYGVYLLMKQYDYPQEMALKGADAPLKDSFFREMMINFEDMDRPGIRDYQGNCYEQHYAPLGEPDCQGLKPYLEMIALEDDAQFSRCVLERMELDSIIRYVLFVQACTLIDNEYNNLGIWAHRENGSMKYHYVPWDLDMSWGIREADSERWYDFKLYDRMLRLDCGGVIRKRTQEIWQELREKAFNQNHLYTLLARYEHELNETGAYYRDALRWESHGEALDTYNVYSYALDRFDMMDRRIAELTDEKYTDRQIMMAEYETVDLGVLDDTLRGLE